MHSIFPFYLLLPRCWTGQDVAKKETGTLSFKAWSELNKSLVDL